VDGYSGLDISSVRIEETGCQVVETLRWLVPNVEAGARRHEVCVYDRTYVYWV
jgi:hypothetical protein